MAFDVVGATYDVVGQHTILVPPTMYDLRRRRCDYAVVYNIVPTILFYIVGPMLYTTA